MPTRQKPGTVNELFENIVKRFGDKPALIFESEKITFSELDHLSRRAAKGLCQLGVGKGDRVALFLRNCTAVPIALFGAARLGAIPTFLNAFHKGDDVAYVFSNSEPKVLIVEDFLYQNAIKQAQKIKSIQKIYLVGENKEGYHLEGLVLPFNSLLEVGGDVHADVSEEDIAVIIYTAGTEGRPKGAMLYHKGIVRDIFDRETVFKVLPEWRTLIFAPFFHIAGFRHLIMSLYRGNTTYVVPFHPEKALRLIHNEKINYIVGAPAVYHLMFRREDFGQYDLSSVKVAGVGGAPSTPDLVERLFAVFPNAIIYNGYGMTEMHGGNIDNLGEGLKKRPESVGKIYGGHQLKLADENGNTVPAGEVGEVWIKGDIVFKGYWGMPDLTAKKIKDGWLRSGDLGKLDQDGYLYLVGRKSDMIIRGGENVYPQEVENCLEEHPDVEEAAVIGVPDEVMGEEVKAYVTLRKGAQLTEKELQYFCRERIAKFKVPKYVEFTEEIPHVSAGKIDRKELRARL